MYLVCLDQTILARLDTEAQATALVQQVEKDLQGRGLHVEGVRTRTISRRDGDRLVPIGTLYALEGGRCGPPTS